jgi:hypothetical protein
MQGRSSRSLISETNSKKLRTNALNFRVTYILICNLGGTAKFVPCRLTWDFYDLTLHYPENPSLSHIHMEGQRQRNPKSATNGSEQIGDVAYNNMIEVILKKQ